MLEQSQSQIDSIVVTHKALKKQDFKDIAKVRRDLQKEHFERLQRYN